jgi:Family of unknown function (DUF5675)
MLKEGTMQVHELYHGTTANNILGIMKEGAIRPSNGEIYFIRQESQLHNAFAYGADISRSAAFVIKVRAQVPDGLSLKPRARRGAPTDTWVLQTEKPIAVEVLRLYTRYKPGEPAEIRDGAAEIRRYLEGQTTDFNVVVNRKIAFAEGLIGELSVNGLFVCYTLELAWLWNQNNKSCVPPGKYNGFLRHDHKDKWRIELTEVPGHREHVQIHIGNFPRDIKGCVVVGTSYTPDAVFNSVQAYQKLKAAYPDHPGRITVEFKGILATPYGDYPGRRTGNVA